MIRILTLSIMLALTAQAGENLIVNGDFSDGEGKQPSGWSKPDGLTSIWDKEKQRLLLDTTVLQADKKAFEKDPTHQKKAKGGKYATVGAHEGAWLFARPIEIKTDHRYFILEVDVSGPKSQGIFFPKVLLRGFERVSKGEAGKHSSFFHKHFEDLPAFSEQFGSKEQHRPSAEGEFLMNYRHTLHCRLKEDGVPQHFVLAFKLPKTKRYRPDVLLVKPYAYWPLGKYIFDSVRLRSCSKEEYNAARKRK